MKRRVLAMGLLVAALTTGNSMAGDVAATGPLLEMLPNAPVWTGDTVDIDASGILPGQFMFLFISPSLGNIDLGLAQLGLGMPLAMQFMGFAAGTTFHASQLIPPMPQVLDGVTLHTQLMVAGITFGFPIEITIQVSNLEGMTFGS